MDNSNEIEKYVSAIIKDTTDKALEKRAKRGLTVPVVIVLYWNKIIEKYEIPQNLQQDVKSELKVMIKTNDDFDEPYHEKLMNLHFKEKKGLLSFLFDL